MAKPDHAGGPVERLDLLGSIIDDERARLIHIKIGRHILKRYYQKFGNARASVSFLQEATGLTRGSVSQATEDLVSWGYFTRTMGSGKRPTEYHPVFSVLSPPDASSVLQPQDDRNSSVLRPQDKRVLQLQDAKSPSVLQPQEQTHLRSAATHAATVNDNSQPAAAHGLTAAPVGRELLELTVKNAVIDPTLGETTLILVFEDQHGEEHEDMMALDSNVQRDAEAGQKRFAEMCSAMEADISDIEELLGRRVDGAWVNLELRFVPTMQPRRSDCFRAWNIAA